MSPAALDARISRDNFWTEVVEAVYNDVTYKPTLHELSGVLEGVDASAAPQCFRSGDRLKEWFRKLRSEFTEPFDKWGRSGQNSPDRFPDFLSKHNSNLTAKSQRLLLFFAVCRCGTPNAETEFMNMASKLMTAPEKRGYEEGFDDLDDAMAEIPDSISLPSSDGSRKKRRQEGNDSRLDCVANALQSLAPKTYPDLERLRKQSELMKLVGAARSMAIESSTNEGLDDEEYKELAQRHYNMLKEQVRKTMHSSGGSNA